ncbi:MAG TPA: polysaccharide pyruvyl transferase family protein, partial [Fimbriimonadaceae bacterium]|nr:polysaccharide pyruvyl transferase family protein [Fimbriimonadaceae bacterium]
EISKVHGGKIPDMRKMGTPMQIQQRMSRMDAVIAMRLHAGILATSVGVPPYMISYDPKVAAFAKALDLSGSTSIDNLTPQRLFENFQTFYKDKERNTRLLQKKSQEFKEQAEVNLQVLRDSLRVAAPKS